MINFLLAAFPYALAVVLAANLVNTVTVAISVFAVRTRTGMIVAAVAAPIGSLLSLVLVGSICELLIAHRTGESTTIYASSVFALVALVMGIGGGYKASAKALNFQIALNTNS